MSVVPQEFKIDARPVKLLTSAEYQMAEVRADDTETKNLTNIRIQLKDVSTFTNLYHGYLELRLRLRRDGVSPEAPFAANANAAIVNGANSLFSRCVLRVQNQIVETLDEQHLTYMIKSLLHYSEDFARSSGSNEFYFKDTGDLGASANSIRELDITFVNAGTPGDGIQAVASNPLYNKGFVERKARTNSSDGVAFKTITCIIPLASLFGFCSIDRVMSGNQIAIELTKSGQEHHIHSSAGNGFVALDKVSMWLPRILPNTEVELGLKSALGGGVVSDYHFPTYNSYVSSNLPSNAGSNVYKVLTQSEKILHAFVMLRKSIATQADIKCLTRDEISTLEVRLNGKTYPSRRYDNLKTEEGKARAYYELLNYMNRGDDFSSGIQLSFEEFKTRSIYSFDLSNQPENWSKSPSTLEVVGSLEASNNAEDRQWVVCVVSERGVQISYSGSQPVVSIM
jgi:hypothetical protein